MFGARLIRKSFINKFDDFISEKSVTKNWFVVVVAFKLSVVFIKVLLGRKLLRKAAKRC